MKSQRRNIDMKIARIVSRVCFNFITQLTLLSALFLLVVTTYSANSALGMLVFFAGSSFMGYSVGQVYGHWTVLWSVMGALLAKR